VLLEDEPGFEIIGEAQDGGEAIALVARRRPEVVLMDIRMPGMDGPEANRRLAGPGAEHPVKVIVITTFDLDECVFAALRADAAGFLLKDAQPDVLIDAIHAVANGYGLIAPQVTGRLIRQFAALSPNPDTAKVLDALSARERDVLLLIAQGKQQRADRQPTLPRGKHRQDPRQQHPRQTQPHQPRPSGNRRLRGRARKPRNAASWQVKLTGALGPTSGTQSTEPPPGAKTCRQRPNFERPDFVTGAVSPLNSKRACPARQARLRVPEATVRQGTSAADRGSAEDRCGGRRPRRSTPRGGEALVNP
jgi:DNA-binding NarL/FixJ family response regulator